MKLALLFVLTTIFVTTISAQVQERVFSPASHHTGDQFYITDDGVCSVTVDNDHSLTTVVSYDDGSIVKDENMTITVDKHGKSNPSGTKVVLYPHARLPGDNTPSSSNGSIFREMCGAAKGLPPEIRQRLTPLLGGI